MGICPCYLRIFQIIAQINGDSIKNKPKCFFFPYITYIHMKKFIMAVGLLLVAAVFMSGCVTETEDPIVGIWHNDKEASLPNGDFDSRIFVFNADGTGISQFRFDGEPVSDNRDFTWKNEGDGKYIVNYANTYGTNISTTNELVLAEDVLSTTVEPYKFELHRESAAEYLVGLWATDVSDYEELEDIVCLMYVAEDGTGDIIYYGSEVMGFDDVYTYAFTWEEKDGVMYGVYEGGYKFDLTLKEGVLYEGKEEVFHKYAVEDRLLGIWMSDEPSKEAEGTFDIVILIRPDGTGVEIWTVPGSHVASAKYYFDWEMTDSYTYQAVYDDGEVWDFKTFNLGLTDGGVTYSKVGYDVLAEYAKKVTA